VLDELHGAKVFFRFDFESGDYQNRMKDEDEWKRP